MILLISQSHKVFCNIYVTKLMTSHKLLLRLEPHRASKNGRSGVIMAIKHVLTAKKIKLTIWTRLCVGDKEEKTDLKLVWVMATATSNSRDGCGWRIWLDTLTERYLEKLKLVKVLI